MRSREFDPGRRRFLTGSRRVEAFEPALPWASAERFFDGCSRCGDCIAACDQSVIVPGPGGYPRIDFSRGGCTFCGDCAAVCPEPIFRPRQEPAWSLRATLGEACLTFQGVFCMTCGSACEESAITFTPAAGGVPRPAVDGARCSGCGFCVSICPSQALEMRTL